MAAVLLTILIAVASLAQPSLAHPRSLQTQATTGSKGYEELSLADLALQKVLDDASPIYGTPAAVVKKNEAATATWMSAYHDDTLLVHMNIPGTHDSATWNYSAATQASLIEITNLANASYISDYGPEFFRCQTRSFAQMLEDGIRAFDLRYALDVTRTSLVFYHGEGLQSQTATVDNVLFGLYAWLDRHPTEALFLSFQNAKSGGDDATTQALLYEMLTSLGAKKYIVQTRGALGTLGEARGKITLFRRLVLNHLPAAFEASIPGLQFHPDRWLDNGRNFSLTYNATNRDTAFIHDYYMTGDDTGDDADAATNILAKFDAVGAHLKRAATQNPDDLFWGFASSSNVISDPPDTPIIQAVGNGTLTPKGGVNNQLMPLLEEMKGRRLGIVMFDFYEEPKELLPTFLSLLNAEEAKKVSINKKSNI